MLKQLAAAAALVLACGAVMAQDVQVEPKKRSIKAESGEQSSLPKLMVGDKAPAITVAKWVKGEPVTGFEKGHTYMVEFWATWCGPCKKSIPHLTELQAKHKDNLKIIGVSVYEHDQADVEPFVKEEMGEKMNYTVAMDDIPAPKDDSGQALRAASAQGKMAKGWMEPSGVKTIPTAFIVNGEGKVAWIGSPASQPEEMEKALEEVMSGKHDLAAAAKAYRQEKEAEQKLKPALIKLDEALRDSDHKAALAQIDEIIALNPKMAPRFAMQKYMILFNDVQDYDKAYALGNKIVDNELKDDANNLNTLAWFIVDPDKVPAKQDLALAEKASKRSNDLTKNQNPMYLDTLAAVYFAKKDMAKAIELQEKAVKFAEADGDLDPSMVDEIKDRLQKFKKVASGGGS